MDNAVKKDWDLRNIKYQIIGGKIINMAPGGPNHTMVSGGLGTMFRNYFAGKKCRVYNEGNYIRLDIIRQNTELPDKCEKDRYIPDVMVVCDRSIDTINGVTGAPDLIIEVVSPSTEKYDISIKKEVYEIIGVKEYWIVDYKRKSIEVYVLKSGKYGIPEIYYKYSEQDIKDILMQDKDLGTETPIITEFSPVSFPDLIIKIDDIFDDLIEE